MPVRVRELPQDRLGRRLFQIGLDRTGELRDLADLEDANELISGLNFVGRVPVYAYWYLQKFLRVPYLDDPVPVARIGTRHSYSLAGLIEEGHLVVSKAIDAIESGSLSLATSGSDIDPALDPLDLANLQQDQQNGAEQFFLLTCVVA